MESGVNGFLPTLHSRSPLEEADGAEVIELKRRRLASDNDIDAARARHQGREANRRRSPGRYHDGTVEPHVLEDRWLGHPKHGHRGLSHRLEAHHGGKQALPSKDMIVEIGIRIPGERRVGHQLDSRIIDQRPFEEPEQREFARLDLKRRRDAKTPADHEWDHGQRGRNESSEQRDALVSRNRRDPLPRQGIDPAQPVPHADARPDRPLQGEAATGRMVLLELLG